MELYLIFLMLAVPAAIALYFVFDTYKNDLESERRNRRIAHNTYDFLA